MEILVGPRGCGKTTWAIWLSHETGARIITADTLHAVEVIGRAKELGAVIPEPITLSNLAQRRDDDGFGDKFIFDDMGYLLRRWFTLEDNGIAGLSITSDKYR
jgi:hypothetical protein